jgi:ABC-type branched-subunit amino acid transport system substrate-binding protein
VTERAIYRGAMLAIEEINAAGGVCGRPIKVYTEDYASDFKLAMEKAAKLVRDDRVRVVFGGYTSASRVSILNVLEQEDALLLYGTHYEGLECSSHCIYGGAVPNQFLLETVPWLLEHLGTRVYIVGSDYIYPRAVSAFIQRLTTDLGGDVLADRYFPLGATEFRPSLREIKALNPDLIFSNMVGDATTSFYRQCAEEGISPETMPIAATVTSEVETQAMGASYADGHYMAASYFQSIDALANRRFVTNFKRRWGEDSVTNTSVVGMYQLVYLFADAIERLDGQDATTDELRNALIGSSMTDAPEGVAISVYLNHHCNHRSYVGRTRGDGQFEIVAQFESREPEPFPRELVPEDRAPVRPTRVSGSSGS